MPQVSEAHRQCSGPSAHACSPAVQPEPEVVDLASTVLASTVLSLVPSLAMPRLSEFYSDKPQSPSQVSSSKPSPPSHSSEPPVFWGKIAASPLSGPHLCRPPHHPSSARAPLAHMPTVLSAHGPCPLVSASVTTRAVSAHFPLPAGRMSSSF